MCVYIYIYIYLFRRSFQCLSGCRSEGRSPTKWHIPKLPKTSEIAAAVPGILNEGSHNTTVHQPPFFDSTRGGTFCTPVATHSPMLPRVSSVNLLVNQLCNHIQVNQTYSILKQ